MAVRVRYGSNDEAAKKAGGDSPTPEPFDYSKIKEIGELSHVSGTLIATIARPNSITLNANGNNNLTGTYIQIQKTTTVVARVAGTYAVSADGSAFQLNTYAASEQIYHKTSGTKRCIAIYIEQ